MPKQVWRPIQRLPRAVIFFQLGFEEWVRVWQVDQTGRTVSGEGTFLIWWNANYWVEYRLLEWKRKEKNDRFAALRSWRVNRILCGNTGSQKQSPTGSLVEKEKDLNQVGPIRWFQSKGSKVATSGPCEGEGGIWDNFQTLA